MGDFSHLEGHWIGVLGYEFDADAVDGRIVVTSSVDGWTRTYAVSEVQNFVAKGIWRRVARPNILGGP